MAHIQNRTFDEISIGDHAEIDHALTKEDIQLFAVMSGDINPAHLDEEYAASSMYHEVIAHGMWGGALISTVLGTQLPGPGTIYVSQNFSFRRPVTVGDNITARVTVQSKDTKTHFVTLQCECINQDGKPVITGEAVVIAPTEKISRPAVRLPKIEVKDAAQSRYELLVERTKEFAPLKTAIVHPVDAKSLGGALEAKEAGLIIPVLVGPEHRIRQIADEEGFDLSNIELVPTHHSHAAAEKSVALAREGQVEALMKGHIHTDELLGAVLDKVNGLRTARRLSHVFSLDVPTYHKPLFITDAAINIAPDLSQKKDIVQNAIDLFQTCGFGTPKVAIVSAVETVNQRIPSTLDATALCKMAERGQITGGILDGPLGFDNAVSKEAAAAKHITSPVAGDADIIVVPDVEAGNMLYKQMRYLSGIEAAGIVMGARVPIILTSRAASAGITRSASCALALLYARNKENLIHLGQTNAA